MIYQELAPHPGLKRHIKCYWTLASTAPPAPTDSQRFLAEGLEMTFNLADAIEFAPVDARADAVQGSYTCGPMTRPMRIRPTGRVKVFGVCFRPGGAYPFFRQQASELVNEATDLSNLLGPRDSRIVHGLRDRRMTTAERTALLDGYFLRQLDNRCDAEDVTTAAVELITALKGRVRIGRLAREVGLSRRQLERRFKQRVGMSPKQLCRSLRFKHAFRHLATSGDGKWYSAVAACGYYDQSHMIREFKNYTGTSPAAYFEQPLAREPFFFGNF